MVYVMIGIVFLLILGGIIAIVASKKEKHTENEFKVLFILGIMWLPMGVAIKVYPLSIVGLAFTIYGLANKDKWNEESKEVVSDKKKRIMLLFLILGVALVFVSLSILYIW